MMSLREHLPYVGKFTETIQLLTALLGKDISHGTNRDDAFKLIFQLRTYHGKMFREHIKMIAKEDYIKVSIYSDVIHMGSVFLNEFDTKLEKLRVKSLYTSTKNDEQK